MKLKNPNHSPHEGFVFYFIHPSNGETQMVGGANSIDTLETKVRHQFSNLKMPVPENLREIIEHQICLRQPRPMESCWSGGLGDDIHHKWVKPFLAKVASVSEPTKVGGGIISRIRRGAASMARRVGSCGSCGGTHVYEQSSQNLGRAGQINQVVGPTSRR